ncbi:MAG: Asp23/Gls24 family envelope stress response protein [Defluviitaleaceae bacterium]|nr:Asp23/Gls24 family envelope stress response protein [Defluviitaleaceae bacterium]
MTEIKSESGGKVLISDEILAVIAGKAAAEVEGVTGIGVYAANNKALRKSMQKGVSVAVSGQNVKLAVAITVKMGTKLHEVSREVQERVKAVVETMTGLNVMEVNVRISAVSAERQKA